MVRRIIYGILLILAFVFAVGLVLPDKVHVERSVVIQAPASSVFALVDGFRQFDKWSPWSAKDPQLKVQISGPLYGTGARYQWSGNQAVGSGTQQILTSVPYSDVKSQVSFGDFPHPAVADFVFSANGQGSKVTWAMDIPLGGSPISHYFGPMVKKQVEPDFERGLANLKALAEAGAKADFSGIVPILAEVTPQGFAYVSVTTTTDPAAIDKAMTDALGKAGEYMKNGNLKQLGAPIAVTRRWDPQANVYQFDAGFPVDRTDVQPPAGSEAKIDLTYGGTVLKIERRGPHKDFQDVYKQLEAFKAAYALQDNGASWEQYLSDPAHTAPADLVTDIYMPVK
jgi:hypothetical protein